MPKRISLSTKILRFLVSRYHDTESKRADVETIADAFFAVSETAITDALTMLDAQGFLSVTWASGVIYQVVLTPKGIAEAEENTPCKNSFRCLRDVWQMVKK